VTYTVMDVCKYSRLWGPNLILCHLIQGFWKRLLNKLFYTLFFTFQKSRWLNY